MTLYHNQPDSIAQKYGINSAEFNVTLKQLDESFGMFVEQLKANRFFHLDDFNVIVLSDQGVSNINRNIVLSDYINDNDVNIWSFSRSLVHLKQKIDLDRLLLKLSKIPDITVTLKEDMPTRLHYRNNRRIGDVILSALEGVGFIYVNKEPIKFNHNGKSISLNDDHKRRFLIAAADKATNGYDKAYENMGGIFMAKGPMFKRNFYSEEAIENIDIYPLICNLLAIECEQRNGTDKAIRTYLKYEHRIVKLESEKQVFMNESNKSIKLNHVLGQAVSMSGTRRASDSSKLFFPMLSSPSF
jgi:predicted AlkP superfamily pyrophosphatase or phosphodiesterase